MRHTHTNVSAPNGLYAGAKGSEVQVTDSSGNLYQLGTKLTPTAAQMNKAQYQTVVVPLGAVNATTTFSVLIAPAACTLTQCKLVTQDAIAKSDTNYWTITLTDKGAAGAGTDKIAEATTKATGGTAFAAYDAWDIGTLNATHKVLAAGDVVTLTLTKTESAVAFDEAAVMLEFTYTS